MQTLYICPYWGQEDMSGPMFLTKVLQDDYDGIEINFPESDAFLVSFQHALETVRAAKHNFVFIAQQVPSLADESVDEHIRRVKSRLEYLVSLEPDFINSHTGKDYFSFDDNCRIIDVVENFAHRNSIPIMHETHRGRFTFHAATLLPYLEKFPDLQLTGDFSHWCTVSESMLQDQQHILEKIIPHIQHIHARVGYEHSPQVNDPFAPEWSNHLKTFFGWWSKIVDENRLKGNHRLTITPEFGPVPYMPTLPYSRKPIADQWIINHTIKNLLKRKFQIAEIVN
jgi:hypothetical protein